MISGRRSLVAAGSRPTANFWKCAARICAPSSPEMRNSATFSSRLHPPPGDADQPGSGQRHSHGSRHSANTLRLREFLTRNGHPHAYVDLDTDASAQELLDRFQITMQEVPVVICNNRTVLRSPSIQELARCLASMRISPPRS